MINSPKADTEVKKTVFSKTEDTHSVESMTNISNYAKSDCCLFSPRVVVRPAFISFDHNNKNKEIQHSGDIA